MSSIELLTLMILVGFSAFFSAAEVALFSLNRFQLRSLRENLRNVYRNVKTLLADPSGLLITILLGNEVVNISISALMAGLVLHHWEAHRTTLESATRMIGLSGLPEWFLQTTIGTLITIPIILFAGEITPKVTAARANQIVASLISRPMMFFYRLFTPARYILKQGILWVSRATGARNKSMEIEESSSRLREDEFLYMVEMGHKEGTVDYNELELIRNVFELDDTQVGEVFTPIQQVHSLPASLKISEALRIFDKKKFSRIPIYGKNKRDIVGVIQVKDLLLAKLTPTMHEETLESISYTPYFVSPQMKLNTLFRRLKENKTHMAFVQNESEETIGIVSMKDLLDELFQDLFPENK